MEIIMSSTDTNGGHQVISHLGIVQLWALSNLQRANNVLTSLRNNITYKSKVAPQDAGDAQSEVIDYQTSLAKKGLP